MSTAPVSPCRGALSFFELPTRSGLASRPLGLLGPEIAAAALADWLFWDYRVGLSFAVFCAALAGAAFFGRPCSRRRRVAALALLIVGLLPVVENLDPLSVLFALLATSGAVGLALPVPTTMRASAIDAILRLIDGPRRICRDLQRGGAWRGRRPRARSNSWLPYLAWALPLAAGAVFLALFADANPVVADLLTGALQPTLDLSSLVPRATFCVVVAVVVWPLTRPRRSPGRPRTSARAPVRGLFDEIPPALRTALFGEAAVFRALLLCNALFAAQLALDGVYLWAGVALPHGMTYAEYAHRGAYPLIVTALLAGAFVLSVRGRRDGASSSRAVTALLLLFIGQNVVLVGTAAQRLWLYIGAYGLTEWRVAAFCWMALVACGLLLIAVQVVGRQSDGWLAARLALAGVVVLYGWCLADVPAFVARYDVANCAEATGTGPRLDVAALLELGPSALPALARAPDRLRSPAVEEVRDGWIRDVRQDAADWRAWSFRAWRLARWLDRVEAAPPVGGGDERQTP